MFLGCVMRWAWIGFLTVAFFLGPDMGNAQSTKSDIGLSCTTDKDCMDGLLCIEVDKSQQLSVCLLDCTQHGQCLTGETCTPLSSGKKVCRCSKANPCKTGFPCVNGFCPGNTYCNTKTYPCLSNKLLCFQPIQGEDWGLCVAPCTSDKDCPPPGTKCLPYKGKNACYCLKDSDCGGGNVCVDAHCHIPCTSHKQCPKDEYCTGTICEPKPPGFNPEPLKEPMSESSMKEPSSKEEAPLKQEPPSDAGTLEASRESRAEASFEPNGPEATTSDVLPESSQTKDKNLQDDFRIEKSQIAESEATARDSPVELASENSADGSGQGCRCSEQDGSGSWLLWFVLFVSLVLFRKRHQRVP